MYNLLFVSIADTWCGEADHSGGVVRQLFTQKPNSSSRIHFWWQFPAWNKLWSPSRVPRSPPHTVSLSQSPAPSALHLSRAYGFKRAWERSSTRQPSWADWPSSCASVYQPAQKWWPRDSQADSSAGLHAQRASHTAKFPRTDTQSTSSFHQQTRNICTSKDWPNRNWPVLLCTSCPLYLCISLGSLRHLLSFSSLHLTKTKEAGTFAQPQAPNLVKPIPVSIHTETIQFLYSAFNNGCSLKAALQWNINTEKSLQSLYLSLMSKLEEKVLKLCRTL